MKKAREDQDNDVVTDKADGEEDFKVMVAESTNREPEDLSDPSSKDIDASSDATPIPASQVRVQTGIGSCPKCGGKLVEEKDRQLAWHYWCKAPAVNTTLSPDTVYVAPSRS